MQGAGRVVFAAIMLLVLGTINIIYGIGALDDANIYVNETRLVLDNLNTLGWVLIIIGVIQLTGGFSLMAGNTYGCQDQIADGTVPNQYGTWWYGRGGWCPGKHVPLVMTDVTDQVSLGAENTFEYEGYYLGAVYTDGDNWRNIRLDSWLVISR